MQYLGGLRGVGTLKCGDETLGRADYDFDGFLTQPGQVIGSGEIRTTPEALKAVFRRKNPQLLTDDGRTLSLRFSERRLGTDKNIAHADVTGELPTAKEWRH